MEDNWKKYTYNGIDVEFKTRAVSKDEVIHYWIYLYENGENISMRSEYRCTFNMAVAMTNKRIRERLKVKSRVAHWFAE
jgi:hypothetical protein